MSKFSRPAGKPASTPAPKAAPAAPQKPTSKYKKSSQVQVGVDANYQRAGEYIFLVQRIEEGTSQRHREDFVSVHSVCVAADGSGRSPLETRLGGMPHRVGEETNWFQKLKGEYFDQNMLKFAIAASNLTQDEISASEEENDTTIVAEMVGPEQPFAGVAVEAHVVMKLKAESKKKGVTEETATSDDVYTVTNWKRRVPYAELKEVIDAEVLERYLPDIDAKIAEESAT